MTARVEIGEASVPRLARGVRLRYDEARERWVVLAPERVLMPDEIATEILKRCTGASVGAIADDLAATYGAPREQVASDITALLQDLADKGLVEA